MFVSKALCKLGFSGSVFGRLCVSKLSLQGREGIVVQCQQTEFQLNAESIYGRKR
jgi:hypothetical protein